MSDVPDRAERLDAIFRECGDPIHAYIVGQVGAQAAPDLVSETFLVAWRRSADVPADHPLPWLIGVARKVCATHRRTLARRSGLIARLSMQRHPQAQDDSSDERDAVHAALSSLTLRDAEAIVLTSWLGFSHTEAADIQGCTTNTFTVRLHRARRRLRTHLTDVFGSTTPASRRES